MSTVASGTPRDAIALVVDLFDAMLPSSQRTLDAARLVATFLGGIAAGLVAAAASKADTSLSYAGAVAIALMFLALIEALAGYIWLDLKSVNYTTLVRGVREHGWDSTRLAEALEQAKYIAGLSNERVMKFVPACITVQASTAIASCIASVVWLL